jgi:hypothetical protein
MSRIPGPASLSSSAGSAGNGSAVQEKPSQCRACGATGLALSPVAYQPAAQASEGPEAETAVSWLVVGPGFGAVTWDHP